MKKILMSLILALCTVVAGAQVKVLGKIEPNGATDTYPTHTDTLGRGGLMAVGTWQERNSIPRPRRKAGMLVRVKSATVDSTYTIGGNLTNADWIPFGAAVDISGKANTDGSNATGNWNITSAQATKLQNARTINGVSFDGTQNINIPTGATWGSITGTLANQTDLNTALNDRARLSFPNTFFGTQRMAQIQSANIAIDVFNPNNTTPSLYINNATSDPERITVDIYGHEDQKSIFRINNTYGQEILKIAGNRKVGINTDYGVPPQATLDVIGDGRFTGQLLIAAPTVNAHAATKKYVDDKAAAIALPYNMVTTNTAQALSAVKTFNFGINILDHEAIKITNNWNKKVTLQVDNTNTGEANANVVLPNSSGTLAMTKDIPKMFTFTTSGTGFDNTFKVPHGLGYTPTIVLVTANSLDAVSYSLGEGSVSLISSAKIDGNDIIITCENFNGSMNYYPIEGTDNLTWSIMVK